MTTVHSDLDHIPSSTTTPRLTSEVTVFPDLKTTLGGVVTKPWFDIFAGWHRAKVIEDKKAAPGYATCVFAGNQRKKSLVQYATAVVLDYDNKTTSTSLDDAVALWGRYYGFVHSSFNHLVEKTEAGYVGAPPRFRVVIPLSRRVSTKEHGRIWLWCERTAKTANHEIDPSAKDASRIWFLPASPADRLEQYEWRDLTGAVMDVDQVLADCDLEAVVDHDDTDPPVALPALSESAERARKYIAKMDAAVEGQNGSATCFKVALALVKGFALPFNIAFEILRQDYNPRCSPPWSDDELRHKVDDAERADGQVGYLLTKAGSRILKKGDHVELADLHRAALGEHTVYCDAQTRVYDPTTGHWKVLENDQQERDIAEFGRRYLVEGDGQPKPLGLTRRTIEDVRKLSQTMTQKSGFFDGRYGVAFRNMFIGIDGTEIIPSKHSPENRARSYVDVNVDDTECPRWIAFLGEIFESDDDAKEKIQVLGEFIGLALLGASTSMKKALVLYGDADSGKSTLINILQALFPPECVSSVPVQDWGTAEKRYPLLGKLINVVSELPERDILDSTSFKAVVAGDSMQARKLYNDGAAARPICGHLFAANSLPKIIDKSAGTRIRWIVLSCNNKFVRGEPGPGEKRARIGIDREIVGTERGAIMMWSLWCAQTALRQGHYSALPSSDAAAKEWAEEGDHLTAFFEDELELGGKDDEMAVHQLYTRYAAWAGENGIQRPLTKITFAKDLRTLLARKLGLRRDLIFRMAHGERRLLGLKFRAVTRPVAEFDQVTS